ncbi:MAG: lysophospholipid acyltransferase family protein, partial [Mycobacterium sp.]
DPTAAVESLHQAEDRAKNGLSIVIAPEGTRLDTTTVGPFKKGAFRMAMAVGIPIVPIVIRNAEVVAARNSATMNPGAVDVAVFPPISLSDWTLEALPERIDEVRQLYLDTLADWPVDELPEASLYRRARKRAPQKAAPRRGGTKAAKAQAKKTQAKKTQAKKTQAKTSASNATKAQPGATRSKGRP